MNLFYGFKNSSEKYPEKISLVVDSKQYTYRQLNVKVSKIASLLENINTENVGIYCNRSLSGYAGILATLQVGKTYVPLNPKFPEARNKKIIELSKCEVLIVDNNSLLKNDRIFHDLAPNLNIIFPETKNIDIPNKIKKKYITHSKDNITNTTTKVASVGKNDLAYIIFTSGSTGIPKGVPVSHGNINAYVDYLFERYDITNEDRFSQSSDITFDLSVHDLFLSWKGGSSLYCIPEKVLMAPAKFIKENRLTVWTSVPSQAQLMKKLGMLKTTAFPSLRYSFFCGESLSKAIVVAWQNAAPNSIIENLYGPTEATVAITHYRVPQENSKIAERNGMVSIGCIFENQKFCLLNEHGVIDDFQGELCLAGSQVTRGYFENYKNSEEQYVQFPHSVDLWYKTGDIVIIENDKMFYLFRKDFQVKVRGFRIELDEINLVVSRFINQDTIYTITVADSLYTFVEKESIHNEKEILQYLSSLLPTYMVPKKIIFLKSFPMSPNGKIDRNELSNLLIKNKYVENKC